MALINANTPDPIAPEAIIARPGGEIQLVPPRLPA
jgi:hypothetical protein